MTAISRLSRRIFIACSLGCAMFASSLAQAQLSIEITGAGASRIPVAIADFAGDDPMSRIVTGTVRGDLERSGLFKMVDTTGAALDENTPVDYGAWKNRGADALAAGSLVRSSNGRVETRFRLYDTLKSDALGGAIYVTNAGQLRMAGHRVADFIYEKLTGERGIFSTRIAYVIKSRNQYHLQIADADGQNPATALSSVEPIISPVWSPDGGRLAYVSFEK